MRKLMIGFVSLLAVLALIQVVGCTGAKEAAYPGSSQLSVFSMFSQPMIQVIKDGVNQFSNTLYYGQAFTGEAVTTAEVTVSNETTGVSTTCAYVGSGVYYSASQLNHGTGESVSTTVKLGSTTMKGGPTVTPNSSVAITSPASSAVTMPFTVTWTPTAGSSPAGHVWFAVYRYGTATPEIYQTLVPFSQTSFTVTSSMISGKGTAIISAYPVNKMSFTGAADNSFGVVGSTSNGSSATVTIN